jgi:hypothetical protein
MFPIPRQKETIGIQETKTKEIMWLNNDECRQNIDDNKDYKSFSVPLENWVDSLLIEESSSESAGALQRQSLDIQVIFIQLYRDYTQSPWSGLAEGFLEIFYNAGTAFYIYPGCELIDFVAPTIISKDNQQPTYSTVLVSIKSRLYLPPKNAMDLYDKLK